MKRIINIKTICIFSIIILLGLGYIFFTDNSNEKEYKNTTYSVKYNSIWKVNSSSDKKISLTHKRDSTLNIEIMDISDDYEYKSLDNIKDDILYSIEKQNKKYKLIASEKSSVTKNNYEGYKVLYENEDNQVLVVIAKKSNQIIIFTYEATSDYFDILLDSVNSIIYNFKIMEKEYSLSYKLSLDLSNIKWKENDDIKLKKNKAYEAADYNYLVKYSIPSNFIINDFDSTGQIFKYQDLSSGNISISTSIQNINIYEYLDKENKNKGLNLAVDYIKKNKDTYKNIEENLNKLESKYDSYVYKIAYTQKNEYTKKTYNYEEVYLIYSLDKNHIFIIKIDSTNSAIPKELIDNINIDSTLKYANYINKNIVNGYLENHFKKKIDDKRYYDITLHAPTTYEELDKGYNIYAYKFFGFNCDDDTSVCEYNIDYELTKSSMEIKLKYISSDYEITDNNYIGKVTLNDKEFDCYEVNYDKKIPELNYENHSFNEKILFYKLEDNNYFIIKINRKDNKVDQERLKETTKFDINIYE